MTTKTTKTECPICEGALALWDAQGQRMIPCECQKSVIAARRLRKLMVASSFLPEMATQAFSNFAPDNEADALRAVVAWAAGKSSPWVFLTGSVGTGKTHLLAAATNALMARGEAALYVLSPDLLDYIRAGFGSLVTSRFSGDDATARLDLVREVDWLIVDELGKERGTDFAHEQLFSLLDYRYRRHAHTLIASNQQPSDQPDYLASRLGDRAMCQIVQMANIADYRLLPPEERYR
ncbi:MAG TPA: ATP-binding protein [Ktedonobacterales bacterium]|nr:ATP-binding protein [Ktedonobacterales bacterium]